VEYVRLDGSMKSDERMADINSFNESNFTKSGDGGGDEKVYPNDPNHTVKRVFLISTKAGGIGVNLFTANRIILMDSSWNPSNDQQAIGRCYRMGQKRPVIIYRLVSEGTLEQKIYRQGVQKVGLGRRINDLEHVERMFDEKDLTHLFDFGWVECSRCKVWRMLPPWVKTEEVDAMVDWTCDRNLWDAERSSCEAAEIGEREYLEVRVWV